MLAAERRDLLVARLRRDGKLVARDLAAELGLSESTRSAWLSAAAGWVVATASTVIPARLPASTRTSWSLTSPSCKRAVACISKNKPEEFIEDLILVQLARQLATVPGRVAATDQQAWSSAWLNTSGLVTQAA